MTANWCIAEPRFLIDIVHFLEILRKIMKISFMAAASPGTRSAGSPTHRMTLALMSASPPKGSTFLPLGMTLALGCAFRKISVTSAGSAAQGNPPAYSRTLCLSFELRR